MTSPEHIQSNTANPQEISHFDSLGAKWWDEKGPLSFLHSYNKLRIPWILKGLKDTGCVVGSLSGNPKPLEGLRILDVGCGGGFLTEPLARLGSTIVGVDLSENVIQIARAHAAQDPSLTNLTYLHESVDYHARNNFEKYDVVIVAEVVDHVDQPELFLKACAQCLKPGGTIFVGTINRTLLSWFIIIIAMEYVLGWIPRGTHTYDKFITPEEVGKMLENCNCRSKKVEGMFYNPFTDIWSFSNLQTTYGIYGVKNG